METKYKSKKMEVTDEFKSHYVVWKHIWTKQRYIPISRLNRTMQYGNEVWDTDGDKSIKGLNRTMQYGN